MNCLTLCLHLGTRQQHRKIKTQLPTITAFVCLTEDAKEIFCTEPHMSNSPLGEVMPLTGCISALNPIWLALVAAGLWGEIFSLLHSRGQAEIILPLINVRYDEVYR